jgi:hypothetical protein
MDGKVIFGQSFTLRSGETLTGDLVVVGGEAVIEKGASVEGDTVVIGGGLQVDGTVAGDVVVVGGLLSLGSAASVARDVVNVGGSLQRAEGAHIGGNIVTNFAAPTFQLPRRAVAENPQFPPRPNVNFDLGPLGSAAAVFFQSLGLAALAMLLTVFLHPQLDRVARALVRQPLIAGSIGIVAVVSAAIAAVILAVTLILIPVALAAILMLVLAWLFGVVSLGLEVGDRLTRAMHRSWEPVVSAGLGTFVLAVSVGTVGLIPCVGWLAPALVGLLGLGAAVITVFGTRGLVGALPAATVASDTSGGTLVPPGTEGP